MKKREKKKLNVYGIIGIVLILCVFGVSIGYAAFSRELIMTGIGAEVTVQTDLRVSNMSLAGTYGGASSSYEEFSLSGIKSAVNLPNQSSTVTYEVEITNIGNTEMGILNITGLPNNLTYSLTNYNLSDKLCDDRSPSECSLGSTTTFLITIGYVNNGFNSGNINYNINLNFDFKQAFTISYVGFISTANLPTTILSGETKTINFNSTQGIPSTIEVVNASRSYTSPNLTLSNAIGNVTVTRRIGITYFLNGGVNPDNQITSFVYPENLPILNAYHIHDAAFVGWYENSGLTGSIVTSTEGKNSDMNLYASWTGTIDNTTFNTTTNRFTASNLARNLVLNDFRDYQYVQSNAHTTISSVGIYITYYSSNKDGNLTCQIQSNSSGFTTTNTVITFARSQNNATVNSTITLPTSITAGSNYTISCPTKGGDNNGKIEVRNFEFMINP